jgi:hypothetical protein
MGAHDTIVPPAGLGVVDGKQSRSATAAASSESTVRILVPGVVSPV